MKPAEQVKWMSRNVRRALVDLDFSMLDYQEDAAPYCARHPSDTHTEAHLTDLGRECRAYLIAHPEPASAYDLEAEAW